RGRAGRRGAAGGPARALGDARGAAAVAPNGSCAEGVALIVSVGGDGTFLRAARAASMARGPVLGVKEGRVGFLTEAEPEDAAELIEDALAGRALVEERLAVLATPEGCAWSEPQWGLNEVMVEKRAR